MRRLLDFLTNLDAKAWRTLAVSFVLFGGVGIVFLFGAQLIGLDGERTVQSWMAGAAGGPWALPVAVGAFAGLAFLGVPQIALIAAAVVVFGPWYGMLYSWIGTMVSALVGFGLGRTFGAGLIRDYAGDGVRRFMLLVGRNGFMASLIVRLVPSAPFIVVNMAAGVTPMSLVAFTGGTAIGIVPKIALTAFAGHSVISAMRGGGLQYVLILVGVAAAWLASGLVARAWLKRREAAAEEESPPEP
jgi:uncharacterized membrane protein YdjX (TVP38/TMEM64 family)